MTNGIQSKQVLPSAFWQKEMTIALRAQKVFLARHLGLQSMNTKVQLLSISAALPSYLVFLGHV